MCFIHISIMYFHLSSFLQHTLIDQSFVACFIINLDFKLHFFVKINILLVKQRIRARLFVNRALYKPCINK